MKNNNTLTLILPVLNGEQYIKNTLKNICSQTFEGLKIIISDNSSKDNTYKICKKFKKKYKNITLVKKKNTVSFLDNFISGLKLAKTKYIIFCSHDDYFNNKNYIKNLFDHLEPNSAPFGSVVAVNENNQTIKFTSNKAKIEFKKNKLLRRLKFFFSPDILIPKNCITYAIHEKSYLLKCLLKVKRLKYLHNKRYSDNYVNYMLLNYKKIKYVKKCILYKRLKKKELIYKKHNISSLIRSIFLQFKLKYGFIKFSNFLEALIIILLTPFYIFIESILTNILRK